MGKNIKIVKIEKIPQEDRYDLSVENTNNFFANDLLVHNCRALISTESHKIFSRGRKEFNSLPEISLQIKTLKEKAGEALRGVIYLDGELYSDSLTFNQISSIVSPKKTIKPLELRSKISYYIFDVLTDEPQFKRLERIEKLKKIIKDNDLKNIKICETKTLTINSIKEDLAPLAEKYIDEGYEGIMLRSVDGKYEHRRSYGVFKYKLFFDCEAVCVGFKSERNREDKLGSVIFEYKGERVDARPAMTEEARQEMWRNQEKYIGKTGVLKYQELSEYQVPRFPVFTGKWRESWDLEE